VGDLLVTKDGTLGVTRVVSTDRPFSIFVSLALLKPLRSRLHPEFAALFLTAAPAKEQYGARQLGSALQHLHLEVLAAIQIPVPPLDEQHLILTSLGGDLRRIATIIGKARDQIGKLHEYRAALISAAVTGKIDVRGAIAE
jgi:type I restriction enzyme S subunit